MIKLYFENLHQIEYKDDSMKAQLTGYHLDKYFANNHYQIMTVHDSDGDAVIIHDIANNDIITGPRPLWCGGPYSHTFHWSNCDTNNENCQNLEIITI